MKSGVAESLATIIGGRKSLSTAAALLEQAGGFAGLTELGPEALRSLGVPPKAAERLSAAFRLLRHGIEPRASHQQVCAPKDVAALLTPKYGRLETERFGVVLLSARHRVIQIVEAARGGVAAVVTPPANIFRTAIRIGCGRIVLFHNHPSGDPKPSPEDIGMTGNAVRLGEQLGVTVVDHIVIASGGFTSIRESDPNLFEITPPLRRAALP